MATPQEGMERLHEEAEDLPRKSSKSYNSSRKLERDRRESGRGSVRDSEEGAEREVADPRRRGNTRDNRGSSRRKNEPDRKHSERSSSQQTIGTGDGDKVRSSEGKFNANDLLQLLQRGSPMGSTVPRLDVTKEGPSAADLEAQWQEEEQEKRRKEEEEKKRVAEEQERLAKEEEERNAREEEERIREEEMKVLTEYMDETKERLDWKAALRKENLKIAEGRPDETVLCKLDSSLKKNTAFVKRLRNLTEVQRDALIKDYNALNLSKYIGEAAAAVTEAKLKMSDIPCALQLCSLMHQRYSEFSSALLDCWTKVLLTKKDTKVPNPSKLRVDLRFFAELVSVGVFTEREGLPVLASQLHLLTHAREDHSNLTILTSFCRHCGDDYAGLLPRKFRLLAKKYNQEIQRSNLLVAERQRACRNLLRDYFQSLSQYLVQKHQQLRSMENQNRNILQTKGELTSERREKHETALQSFQKLHQNALLFADLLDEDLPEFPEEEIKYEEGGLEFYNPSKAEYRYEGDTTLFEDEETRTFYECLPDLKSLVPGILYKDSEGSPGVQEQEMEMETDGESLKVEDVEMELAALKERKDDVKDDDDDVSNIDETADMEEEDNDAGSSLRLLLDNFLVSLPTCVNRELIDKAAMDFCMNLNTKTNRRKLVRALYGVHRTRYDLLPFYGRFVAILHPCMPDIATDLGALLKRDFKWHMKKKDQINIESKLKTVRFIGELGKFGLFAKSEVLHSIKLLLFDFTHHNIEMVCALLECCGRFLYRSPDSHHRTKIYLDVLMRKKTALHLDGRYLAMIENAYYYSNPPDTPAERVKDRPPLHQYIRQLLYRDLSKLTTERVLRQMRKLSWDDPQVLEYAVKCITCVWNMRFGSIHCMANLLAGLAPYHEHVAIRIVDNILEDVRVGMEMNLPKYNQRRVAAVKYLGELYNYRLVESAVIFQTLYSFITFGVSSEDNPNSPLDPPEHLFRIRLACVLLETCGQYFDHGSSRKKLDCYLIYFQRYYWYKRSLVCWSDDRPFPIGVEYLMRDTVESLRPRFRFAANTDEAKQAAEVQDKEIIAKIEAARPRLSSVSEEEYLSPIHETEDVSENAEAGVDEMSTQESEGSANYNSHSYSQPIAQRDEELEEEDEDFITSAGEDDDDQVTLRSGPKRVECPEDEDFMTAFDKMMTEMIQARNNESVKVPQLDIPLPVQIKSSQKSKLSFEEYEDRPQVNDSTPGQYTVNFTLMTKRGNKPQFATLAVPVNADFAAKYREREQAEKKEKEKMKRVVLDIHERQEEEDYQEMLANATRPAPLNLNRERRVRYQHPKGAPDADAIFGTRKSKAKEGFSHKGKGERWQVRSGTDLLFD